MHTIIHISADYPDPLVPTKTKAVENLISSVGGGFRHIVYSLNRANWGGGVATLNFGKDRLALAYGAPPYGIRLTSHLLPVMQTILKDIERRGVVPDLIHAHKFTIEGLVAADLSERLGCPFVASLWGDTDIKVFKAKRELRSRYLALARQAALLLPAAPWTADYFSSAFALDRKHFELLPVITMADALMASPVYGAPSLVSAFSLDSWHRKNVDTLAKAIALIASDIPNVVVDIFGSGSPKSLLDITQVIHKAGVADRIRLMGPLQQASLQQTMNGYAAFVMPTRRETYGMVHVEAILAGLPILWSRDRGIDGFLYGQEVGYCCDPSSVEDVANGLRFLIAEERRLKQEIARLQAQGAFDHLRRVAIADRYRSLLMRAIGQKQESYSAASASSG